MKRRPSVTGWGSPGSTRCRCAVISGRFRLVGGGRRSSGLSPPVIWSHRQSPPVRTSVATGSGVWSSASRALRHHMTAPAPWALVDLRAPQRRWSRIAIISTWRSGGCITALVFAVEQDETAARATWVDRALGGRLALVRSGSRARQRTDACSRAEASVVVSRSTRHDRHTSPIQSCRHTPPWLGGDDPAQREGWAVGGSASGNSVRRRQ
jgi:hypothetical protein